MPFQFSWPNNSFLAEFTETVTAKDVEAVNYAFSGDERMESVRYSIWDFSRAQSIQMPDSEIENAAAFDKGVASVRARLKGALIVSDEDIRAQIEKYLAVAEDLSVEWDTRIFETMESAMRWLEPDRG